MQNIDLLLFGENNWTLVVGLISLLILLFLYIETKQLNLNYHANEQILSSDYLTKHESLYVEDQYVKYRQFFDTLNYFTTNDYDPIKLILKIHSEFKAWLLIKYSAEKIDQILANEYIENQELESFIREPIDWFKPYYLPHQKYFLNRNDKPSIAIGIAKLIPVFKELEKMLFSHMGLNQQNTQWKEFSGLERRFIIIKYQKLIRNLAIIVAIAVTLWIVVKFS